MDERLDGNALSVEFLQGRYWTPREADEHINYLETKAVSLPWNSALFGQISDKNVQILLDNTADIY